jgi:hypothetical protein
MFDFEIVEDLTEVEPDAYDPKPRTGTCECGMVLDKGYCRNDACEWDRPEPMYDCRWCGFCADPEHCVWSVVCPVCGSEPKTMCVEGTKQVGLHEERWVKSGGSYRF